MRRKTTTQKIIEGDAAQRGKGVLQRRLAAEPRAQHGLPDAPEYLNERARAAWYFWREQLEIMQIDHAPDAPGLAGACAAYARAIESELLIEREGAVIKEPIYYKGTPVLAAYRTRKHPAVTVAHTSWAIMKAFCVEFGLTPLSRTRLSIEHRQDADNDVNELLRGPRLTADESRKLQ